MKKSSFSTKFVRLLNKKPALSRKKATRRSSASSEVHYLQADLSASVYTGAAPTILTLNQTAEGNDYTDRTGRSIIARAVRVAGKFASPAAGSSDHPIFYLVWDKQANSVAATVADIFYSVLGIKSRAAYNDRFQILKRVMLPTPDYVDNTTQAYQIPFYFECGLGNRKVDYAGTGAGVPVSGALYLICAPVSYDADNAISIYTEFEFTDP